MTDAEELELVEAAISEILGKGQEVSISGVAGASLKRANLKELYARRDMLTTRVARASRGRTLIGFEERS